MNEDPAVALEKFMADKDYALPSLPVPDGQIHRFQTGEGRKKNRDGWYINFGDVAIFGDWSNGEKYQWAAKSQKEFTPEERADFRAKIEEQKRKHKEALQQARSAAAERAETIWSESKPASDDHPYLVSKNVKSYGLRESNDSLVIPLRDPSSGQIRSLQFISPDGEKRFLKNGEKKGCCFAIKGSAQQYLAEGYATGADIHEAIRTGNALNVSS